MHLKGSSKESNIIIMLSKYTFLFGIFSLVFSVSRYVQHYDLPEPTDLVYEFLGHVAMKNNRVNKLRSQTGGSKLWSL